MTIAQIQIHRHSTRTLLSITVKYSKDQEITAVEDQILRQRQEKLSVNQNKKKKVTTKTQK